MAIVKMKHLQLIGMAEDRAKLLAQLRELGCVELDEVSVDKLADEQGESSREQLLEILTQTVHTPTQQTHANPREQHAKAERALEILKRHAATKDSFLKPKPKLHAGELLDPATAQKAQQAAGEIIELEKTITALRLERAKLQDQKRALLAWRMLPLPLELHETEQTVIELGTMPIAAYDAMPPLDEGLVAMKIMSSDRENHYIFAIYHKSLDEQAQQQWKQLGWSKINMGDYTGTARDNVELLDTRIAQLEEKIGATETQLAQMGDCCSLVRQMADRALVEMDWDEVSSRRLDTSQTFFVQGWIPAQQLSALAALLKPFACAYSAHDPAPEEYSKVPVSLKNSRIVRPMNMVTEMYSLPAYGTGDPNPLMFPFFVLFYGIMMADMGYGLVMMLASTFVLMKKRPSGGMQHLLELMQLCGVSTFIMGAITGGFFGDFLSQLALIINPNSTFALPALFTPLDDTIMILIGSMCLGAVQIITGMAVSFVRKLRGGQVMDAVWEEVTWWLVFAGAALAILGITNLVLYVSGVMILIGAGWNAKGFGKITAIFGSLYNHVTGYFGDILSYARLMALMLAGSVIAQVFNTLGAIPGNVFIFLIISFAGNTLNFGLNVLGCYVHDLRLQCLEFFGKFYEDGGRPFKPLTFTTKYYDVVK